MGPETRYLAPLAAFGRGDTGQAGGKGASLGELTRAGLPVPDGFVLTTSAYRAHLRHSGLADRLAELLAAAPDGSLVRAAVRDAPLPPDLAAELRHAYAGLVGTGAHRGAVAVRSSATAEDLPGATFAGQQDTYLNVLGEEELAAAVRGCWASLSSERAIAYRRARGVRAPGTAVVVQRMVPAESAGVLFTANPVTGARDEVVVEAGTGLGDAVAAGTVTPEQAVLDKRTGRILGWRAAREAVLDHRQLRRLLRLGVEVERRAGAPQDVEWAWAAGRPYLLQSRAVTALPPPPPAGRLPRAVAALIAEVIPVRPYPLDTTTWLGSLYGAAAAGLRRLGLRLSPLSQVLVERDGVVVRIEPPRLRPTWQILLLPARLRRLAREPAGVPAVLTRPLPRPDLRAAAWSELLAVVARAGGVPAGVVRFRLRHLPEAVSVVWLWLLLVLVRRTDRLGALVSGTDNRTAETGRALDALAARIRADPDLSALLATGEPARLMPVLAARHPAFHRELAAFLDRYGHRETASPLLVTQPTWRDAPEVVLGLLRARAATPPVPAPGRPAWQVAREELLAHPLLRPPPVRRAVRRWLRRARRVFQVREDSRFYLTLPLPLLRACILELGHRLRQAGVVDEPAGVFHLTRAELSGISWPPDPALVAELRTRIARRAAARAALAGRPLVDPSWYRPPARPRPAVGVLLRGMPGSPGTATGPARIVPGAGHFRRVRTGDVLVTPYTNPAWTPLFARAAAVVVDTGGAMSHAAIVAREYGIPAVMATGEGTRRLADGQPVRVDGTRGLVLPG
jgi:pyruvate,water dikinase